MENNRRPLPVADRPLVRGSALLYTNPSSDLAALSGTNLQQGDILSPPTRQGLISSTISNFDYLYNRSIIRPTVYNSDIRDSYDALRNLGYTIPNRRDAGEAGLLAGVASPAPSIAEIENFLIANKESILNEKKLNPELRGLRTLDDIRGQHTAENRRAQQELTVRNRENNTLGSIGGRFLAPLLLLAVNPKEALFLAFYEYAGPARYLAKKIPNAIASQFAQGASIQGGIEALNFNSELEFRRRFEDPDASALELFEESVINTVLGGTLLGMIGAGRSIYRKAFAGGRPSPAAADAIIAEDSLNDLASRKPTAAMTNTAHLDDAQNVPRGTNVDINHEDAYKLAREQILNDQPVDLSSIYGVAPEGVGEFRLPQGAELLEALDRNAARNEERLRVTAQEDISAMVPNFEQELESIRKNDPSLARDIMDSASPEVLARERVETSQLQDLLTCIAAVSGRVAAP